MVIKTSVLARRLRALTPVLFLGALFLYALWPWLPMVGRSSQTHTIVFYGFSILDKVMTQSIFPAFQESWQGQTGQRVEFTSSFAGSGTVTNQVIMGVPADLVLLSLELDAQRLSDNRVTPPQSWWHLPHRGVINRTPFIILVRPGNPKSIHDFADLARPGVRIVHPDPLTSGAANWAILAEYGAALRRHPEQPEAGHNLLKGIWRNVVAQAASARAARTQFENGFGDALITYEQEALWDRASGTLHAEIVYPHSTVLSEHTLVVIDRNVAPGEREMVDAFVAFLWSETAQRIFIRHGFRSVDERLNEANASFGNIEEPFLVEDFGGWARAKREIIDGIWKNQVLKELGR
jgi:sulfate/thiosulfate transport system substrate-binding protein